jgi:N-acetyl-anhydromuramyl-L-alanine amidase AmpD
MQQDIQSKRKSNPISNKKWKQFNIQFAKSTTMHPETKKKPKKYS